ncbi:MAG TPA: ATP-binding protein [Nitrolancea sp.]|nr:ATP-binding protein [Nitrolancea sp.]
MFTRLHWRIAASYVGLIALVLLALGIYLTEYLQSQQLSALESQLERQARLVANDAQTVLTAGGPAQLDPLAKRLGREIEARITLIAPDGTVLGDSDHDPATMDNHATRPEVAQALRQGTGESRRYSVTLEEDLLYVAVPITRDGTTLGVARVALPVSQIQAASNRLVAIVATALIVAALLAVILAVVVARVTTGRVQALTSLARQLADGNLDRAIPVEGRDEVSQLAGAFNEMASELRDHVQAVEDQRERLAAVLSYMGDGVIIAGRDGVVQLINPAASRLLQLPPTRAEGRSVMAIVQDHELAELAGEAMVGDAVAERPRLIELGAHGQRRAIQAMASRIPGGEDGGQRVLLMLHDVTELRRAETMRREIAANISHELRTPVAALKALVETLEDGALEDPEVARDFLSRMHVEVDGLAQLVEELLELSRIESGQVALRLKSADLGSVVVTAAERLRPQSERLGVSFTVHAPGDLPPVRIDPDRIQQVVINLVHNAVKFTPPGGHIAVTVEHRGNEIVVSVADNGVGIAPDALQRLFERFYKADKARTGGGTGLGLAIAKHLVQVHGGRIWAESPGEGQGATFTFAIPVMAPSTGV